MAIKIAIFLRHIFQDISLALETYPAKYYNIVPPEYPLIDLVKFDTLIF